MRAGREDMDYSPLGPRKLSNSLDNFLLVLEDLLRFAPEVWLAERVTDFLDSLDPARILYFKPEEVQNFERWMQVWMGPRFIPRFLFTTIFRAASV